ncbi:MAG: tetratricopeptide repeat protein [Candidatus Thorarchaeota archaeon]|nr:tetratricopeptide repeat protein [Candidatus Thorarchaeota archaeon]
MNSTNPKARQLFDIAFGYMKTGDLVRALSYLKQAIDTQQDYVKPWVYLATIINMQGNTEVAEQTFLKALEINPNDEEALNATGHFYQKQGKLDKALKYYEQLARANPDKVANWGPWLLILFLKQDHETEEKVLREALTHHPTDENFLTNLGSTLSSLGKLSEAEELLRKAVELYPKKENAWVTLSNVLEKMENHSDAEIILQRVLKMNPRNDSAWVNYGTLLSKQNRSKEAIEAFKNSIKYGKKPAFARLQLGLEYYKIGENKRAENEAKQAIRLYPKLSGSYLLMGKCMKDKKEFKKAMEFLGQYLSISRDDADAWILLAEVYEQLGDSSQAASSRARADEIRNSKEVH